MHRVMDKNCVKASCSTKSGLHDVNESKWCNAYADDTNSFSVFEVFQKKDGVPGC